MRKPIILVTASLLLANSAQAATFRIDDLSPEQGCECDCFTGLYRQNDKRTSGGNGQPPLIFIIASNAQVRIDGRAKSLISTRRKNATGWFSYADASGTTVIDPQLRTTKVEVTEFDGDKSKKLHLAGTLKVTHNGQTQNIAVKGFDVCI
ncbi:MAG: hypothetical protein QM667_04400 [Asticcacaulis sp.]